MINIVSTLLTTTTNLGSFRPPSQTQEFGPTVTSGAAGQNVVLNGIETILSNIIGVVTILGGVFFILYFLLAAFSWLSAGSDSGKVEKARNQMVQGIIGLIVLVAAYSLVGLIGSIVGLNLLQPAQQIIPLIPSI